MSEIKCTGNNGNGCFMDSSGHNCGCEGLKEFGEKLKTKKTITEEEKQWWLTLDMNDPYLCSLWCKMFGTVEQRIKQLYIIRDNQNFRKKE